MQQARSPAVCVRHIGFQLRHVRCMLSGRQRASVFAVWQANVVAPNKHTAVHEPMFRGHLLESETYIGGKVEALESGVFRSDLPTQFKLEPAAYQARPAARLDCIMPHSNLSRTQKALECAGCDAESAWFRCSMHYVSCAPWQDTV